MAVAAGRYSAFDEQLARISSASWKHDRGPHATRELVSRCMAAVKALPHAGAIPEERATRWILRTVEAEAGRMRGTNTGISVHGMQDAVFWHLRRATGIGGSDAGAVLAESRGQTPTFSTARNIAAEKLLLLPPQPATPAMMRGIRAEPWLQRMFLDQTGAQSETDALGTLRAMRDPDAPWRIGTPDDFVHLVVDPETGARRMIDYKCPGTEVYAKMRDDGIGLDYTCQMHHYQAIATHAGIPFDSMAIAAFDAENFVVQEFPVAHDPALAAELERACAGFWRLVESGTLPEPQAGPARLAPSEDASARLAHMTMLRAVSDEIGTRIAGFRDEFERQYRDQRGELRIPSAIWTIADKWDETELRTLADLGEVDTASHEKVSKKPDPDACAAILHRLCAALEAGEDPAAIIDELREGGVPMARSLNSAALVAALAEEGIDTAAARGAATRYRLSTRTADTAVVEAVREEASAMVDDIEEYARGISGLALGEEPEAEDAAGPPAAPRAEEELAPAA